MQGRGVASDATFCSSREHALPAAQRAALRCPRPAGRAARCGDLGLHSPPGADATMMQLIPLRGPHHRCTCWHRDAPGPAGCIGRIIARLSDRRTAGTAAARHAPDFRITGRATRPTWQPAALVARDASRPRRPMSARPPARPSATRHADGPVRRGRGRHASQPPTGRRSWPGPATRLGRSVPATTNLGSSLQAPRSG